MSSLDVYELISKLSSPKVKDRNEALNEVNHVINSSKITYKQINGLCKGLFSLIDSEKSQYIKNESSAGLDRLQTGSSVLRHVILKKGNEFKPSLLKATIDFVTTQFFDRTGHIFAPMAMGLSSILKYLVSYDGHRNIILCDLWYTLVDTIIKILHQQFKINKTDQFLTELLSSLSILLRDTSTSFGRVSNRLSGMIYAYFKDLGKETSVTEEMLKVVNQTLVLMSSTDVRSGLDIVKAVVRIASQLVDTKYEALKDQLLIFSFLSSDYIHNNIYKLVDHEGSESNTLDSDFRENLMRWLDNSLQRYVYGQVDVLDMSMIQFKNNSRNSKTWFDLNTIAIKNHLFTRNWLNMLSLSVLLNSLYKVDQSSALQTVKRRKLDGKSFSTALHQSDSPISVILQLISDTEKSIQILGLQLLVFQLHTTNVEKNSISLENFINYDKHYLSPWVSLTLKTVLEYGWDFNNETLSRLLKNNLSMLNDSRHVSVASQTIIQILTHENFIPDDKSLIQIINSLFESSEFNGPVVLNNDSLKFWCVIFELGKTLKFGEKSSGDKIVDWLISKWNTVDSRNSLCSLPYFVSWLSGSSFDYSEENESTDNLFTRFYSRWQVTSELADFILRRSKLENDMKSHVNFLNFSSPVLNFSGLNLFLEQFLNTLKVFDAEENAVAVSKFLVYGHYIYQHIFQIDLLSSAAESIKYDIQHHLSTLKPKSSKQVLEVMIELNKLKVFNQHGTFILDYLDVDFILLSSSQTPELAEIQSTPDDFADFGAIRKASEKIDVETSLVYTELKYHNSIEQQVLSLLLGVCTEFGFSSSTLSFDNAINYLGTLSDESFCCSFYTFVVYLEENGIRGVNNTGAKLLMQQFGTKLLASYRFQKSPISLALLSRFGIVCSDVLINKSTEDTIKHLADLFGWFIEMAKSGAIQEESSLCEFLAALLHFLKDSKKLELGELHDLYSIIVGLVQNSSNYVKVSTSSYLFKNTRILPWNQKLKFFQDYITHFQNPESSSESSASLLLCLRNMSDYGYPFFVRALTLIFSNFSYPHFKLYSIDVLKVLLKSRNIESLDQLSDIQLLELCMFWFREHHNFLTFPFELFGFQNRSEFFLNRVSMLYAITKSSKFNNSEAIRTILLERDEEKIEVQSVPLLVSLAFTDAGLRDGILSNLIHDSTSSDYPLHTVSWFIQFADVSSERDFFKFLPGSKSKKTLDHLVLDSSQILYSSLFIKVKLSDAFYQIDKIAKATQGLWTKSSVIFLMGKLFESMQLAFDSTEQLIVLRRFKLLMLLAPDLFVSEEVVVHFIKVLTPYLLVEEIHQELSNMMTVFLKLSPMNVIASDLYPFGLLKIHYNLIKVKEYGALISKVLQDLLLEIYYDIDASNRWKDHFSVFQAYLFSQDMVESEVDHIKLVRFIEVSIKDAGKDSVGNTVDLLSLLLNSNHELSKVPLAFETSKHIAKFLWDLLEQDVQPIVRIFAGRYLARYYMETGDNLKEDSQDFQGIIEIPQNANYFGFLLEDLLKIRIETDDSVQMNMINHILGFALNLYHCDPQLPGIALAFEKYLAPLDDILTHIDSFTFNMLHPKDLVTGEFDYVISSESFEERTTISWAQEICIALLYELGDELMISIPLIKYLSVYPELSVKVMNPLWLIYVSFSAESGSFKLETFISNCLDSQDPIADADDTKKKLVLNLIMMVRSQSKKNIRPFAEFYPNIPFPKIYSTATNLGLFKFALLILEEYFTNYSAPQPLKLFSQNLNEIYGGLNDVDLIYGVPFQPSLDYAIDIFNKAEKDPWKRVMFNSASYDSSMTYGDVSSAQGQLFQSLASNNLRGLSNLVNNEMDSFERTSNIYSSFWKLGKWDIPAPSKSSNADELIYSTLKFVNDEESTEKIQKMCENTISDLVSQRNKNIDLLRTLSFVYNVENISGSKSLDYNLNINDYMRSTDGWFKLVPFSTFEDMILVRKILFENIRYRNSSEEPFIAECLELARYSKFARFHNESQKSINSSVQLDRLVKTADYNDKLKYFLTKLSNFESAGTLWSQNETVIPIAMLNDTLPKKSTFNLPSIPIELVKVHDSIIHSKLLKWNSESKQKKFEQLMTDHVEPAYRSSNEIASKNKTAEVFHEIAYFCYKQLKKYGFDTKIKSVSKRMSDLERQFKDISQLLKSGKIQDKEKPTIKSHIKRIKLQYSADEESFETLSNNRKTCIEKSAIFFLKTITVDDTFDDEDVDKFCALWLEFRGLETLNKELEDTVKYVAAHKFIPWVNQLASHLSKTPSHFQHCLHATLTRMCEEHPYHTLYYLMNLRVQKLYEISKTDKLVASRAGAADEIWNELSTKYESFHERVLLPIEHFSNQSIDFATDKTKYQTRRIALKNLKIGEYWLNDLLTSSLPLPTLNNVPINTSGNYDSLPRIVTVDPVVVISDSGISLPKIVKVALSDGSVHKFLLKGGSDDLRQDAIMEQVFEKVNNILTLDKESRRRNLKIRTYKVVPLGPNAGVIEFVADSIALGDILRPLHVNDTISFDEARGMMKTVQSKSKRERISTYSKIAKEISPLFRNFFYETFLNVDEWYKSRGIYSRSLATTSIIGYILGLGDRHLNNILIDKKTGEPVHIDLGVAFDQGKLLPVPETVPFRLTRDCVDGLGVTGVKGSFEKVSEIVYRILRGNFERIIGILNVLKHDPLYNWAISPVRKTRLQDAGKSEDFIEDSADAGRAVDGVESKLTGNGLSVEATVQQLIQEATDPENLALIYLGWAPFF